MSISKFEAAALYDFNTDRSGSNCLIIDLGDCSYGFCSVNKNGETSLLNSWTSINENLWDLCVKAVESAIGDGCPPDIDSGIATQLAARNSIFFNYYISDKTNDAEMFSFSGNGITCSRFEEAVAGVKARLDELFVHIRSSVSEDDLEKCHVIVLGRAQEILLIRHYLKELLSAEPLLPDERFRNAGFADPYDEIVRIGREIYASRSLIRQTYSLLLYDSATHSVEKALTVHKGQERDSLDDIGFIGPVLFKRGDVVTIQIDERMVTAKLPYSFGSSDSDPVELGFGITDEKVALCIRRCRFPAGVYTVPL